MVCGLTAKVVLWIFTAESGVDHTYVHPTLVLLAQCFVVDQAARTLCAALVVLAMSCWIVHTAGGANAGIVQ